MERLAGRVAHEIKNPLNGVALNLEVVRARAARVGAAAGLAQFADAAHADLETLAARIDALLVLARPAAPPIDLYHTVRALGVLYGAVIAGGGGGGGGGGAAGGGGALVVLPAPDTPVETSAAAAAVRFAIASSLDAATGEGGEWSIECGVTEVEGEPAVFVRNAAHSRLGLDNDVRLAANEAGVRMIEGANEITIIFPRTAGGGRESRA